MQSFFLVDPPQILGQALRWAIHQEAGRQRLAELSIDRAIQVAERTLSANIDNACVEAVRQGPALRGDTRDDERKSEGGRQHCGYLEWEEAIVDVMGEVSRRENSGELLLCLRRGRRREKTPGEPEEAMAEDSAGGGPPLPAFVARSL